MSKPRRSGRCDKCGGNHQFIHYNRLAGFICYSCARDFIIEDETKENEKD